METKKIRSNYKARSTYRVPSQEEHPTSRGKYRINSPTIALFYEEDRHVAHMVPAGSVITLNPEKFNGNKLVEVLWADKLVMMFTQDIRTRGTKVN